MRQEFYRHDGVIFKNAYDSGEYSRLDAWLNMKFRGDTIYAVFAPEQISVPSPKASIDTGAIDVPEHVADVMLALAENDELFSIKRSSARSIAGAMRDLVPDVRHIGTFYDEDDVRDGPFEEMWEEHGPDRMDVFERAAGKRFYALERNDRVWIDVSRFAPGDNGSQVYMAAAEYALNARKVFIGDPAGLSDDALIRRTDLMLSIALKHRSTDHIAPHPRQLDGDAKLGVPPLSWKRGDLYGNVRSLIGVSLGSLSPFVQLAGTARFDVRSGIFVIGSGKPLADEAVDRAARIARGAGRPGTGSRTIKRAVLLRSLSREESGEAAGLLERALQRGAEALACPDGHLLQPRRADRRGYRPCHTGAHSRDRHGRDGWRRRSASSTRCATPMPSWATSSSAC